MKRIFTFLTAACEPTAIDQLPLQGAGGPAYKILRNGILFINRNGKVINVLGATVK